MLVVVLADVVPCIIEKCKWLLRAMNMHNLFLLIYFLPFAMEGSACSNRRKLCDHGLWLACIGLANSLGAVYELAGDIDSTVNNHSLNSSYTVSFGVSFLKWNTQYTYTLAPLVLLLAIFTFFVEFSSCL